MHTILAPAGLTLLSDTVPAGEFSLPDTEPPADTAHSPLEGATVNGAVTMDVSASDSVGVTRVELYLGGNYFQRDLTSNTMKKSRSCSMAMSSANSVSDPVKS